jgi:outer membrane receptor protein involved in Fe transport
LKIYLQTLRRTKTSKFYLQNLIINSILALFFNLSNEPNMKRLLKIVLLISINTTSIFAETASDSLEDLDLSALFDLDMTVTVASKKAEKVSDAPSMVVAYSSDDMKNLGYYTIRDLANLTTGYSSQYNIGIHTLETRGQKASGFDNNKHLLMVDGIPVRHARAGYIPIDEDMSLYGAQRVEFMKGPGSALYGTGAFSGVINVVGKDLTENGTEASAKMSFGSDNLDKSLMSYVVTKNDNGQFKANGSFFDKEASGDYIKTTAPNEVMDTIESQRNWDDRNTLNLNVSYNHKSGAGIGFFYNKKTTGIGEFWGGGSSQMNDMTLEMIIPYIKYQKELNDIVSLNSYVLGNQSTEKVFQNPGYTKHSYLFNKTPIIYHDYTIDSLAGNETIIVSKTDTIRVLYTDTIKVKVGNDLDTTYYTSADATEFITDTVVGDWAGTYERKTVNMEALVEATVDFDIGSFIIGANYDLRKTLSSENGIEDASTGEFDYWAGSGRDSWPSREHSSFDASENFHTISFYGQYQKEIPVLSGLKVTAGFREDIGITESNNFNQFSPRLALVQKLTDFLNIKALYGTALKAPGIKEVSVNSEIKNKEGNTVKVSDLEAESIKSYEAGLNLVLPKVTASVAVFYNETKDIIGVEKVKGENLFVNQNGYILSRGIEVNVQAMPVQYLKLMVGGSYALANKTYNEETKIEATFTGVPVSKANGAISYINGSKVPFTVTPSFNYIYSYANGGDVDSRETIKDHNGSFYTVDANATVNPFEHFGFEVMVRNLTNNTPYRPADFTGVHIKDAETSVKFSVTANF